jgi:hypothetical protein
MSSKVAITATDNKTITVKLPDGLSVKPGQPVPVEILDMISAHARLQDRTAVAGRATEAASWCFGGCVGQLSA